MLHIPDLTVHANLNAGLAIMRRRGRIRGASLDRRIREDDRGGEVEDAADGDGVLEGAGVEGDKGGARVGERGGAAESQFEGLFEEET